MNKDSYIRIVVKHLGCSKQQKMKVKSDLESDIQIALNSGETFEDIMKRMGKPEQLAQELNDNMGVIKKKSHLKLIVSIGIVIIALVIAAIFYIRSLIPETTPLGTSGLFNEELLLQWSERTITHIHDYQVLYNACTPQMQRQFTRENWETALKTMGELGKYQKITSHYFAEVKQNGEDMAVGEVVALYENKSVTYTLTFTSDSHLAGLYMK
ncbi:DUF3887 domain-containing protein [Candidatus Stoquefichus massiliensis]|uniref:DUF3887 domain-containing protein n=1 Tax=Candidatus Stoquefichus massiliensis TaxID=1470350 RepID=UPI0004B89240|nr:DUF3887 domain-containing protein [Candidatus Stoquefichus massiliensis]